MTCLLQSNYHPLFDQIVQIRSFVGLLRHRGSQTKTQTFMISIDGNFYLDRGCTTDHLPKASSRPCLHQLFLGRFAVSLSHTVFLVSAY